jgi:hypothetical protein
LGRAGLIAIIFNLACFVLVILRHKLTLTDNELARLDKWVRYAGFGSPFCLIAAVIGFSKLFA